MSLFEISSSADLLGLLELCCSSSWRQPEEGHNFATHWANLSAVGGFSISHKSLQAYKRVDLGSLSIKTPWFTIKQWFLYILRDDGLDFFPPANRRWFDEIFASRRWRTAGKTGHFGLGFKSANLQLM